MKIGGCNARPRSTSDIRGPTMENLPKMGQAKVFTAVFMFLFSASSLADLNINDEFQPYSAKIDFSFAPYEISLLVTVLEERIWLDSAQMLVDPTAPTEVEPVIRVGNLEVQERTQVFRRGIQFVKGFYQTSQTRFGPALIVDFKDGSFVTVARDFSAVTFTSPFHNASPMVEADIGFLPAHSAHPCIRSLKSRRLILE